MTGKKAGEVLGISTSTLKRWRTRGVIQFKSVEGVIFYDVSSIDEAPKRLVNVPGMGLRNPLAPAIPGFPFE